jgi:hypothetical protein
VRTWLGCDGRTVFDAPVARAVVLGRSGECCWSGKLFFRLVQQALALEPVPLDRILHPEAKVQARPQAVVLPE